MSSQKRPDILLHGDFNAKVGSNSTGIETVMGKHVLSQMNDKGKMFADFCSFNKLVIGGRAFPHKKACSLVSPQSKPRIRWTAYVHYSSSGGHSCVSEHREEQM